MKEDRKKLLEEYQGDKPRHLIHPWLDYDRYRYSDKIIKSLNERNVDFNKLVVVDYGCGVADYGMEFGRYGSFVIFYDNETYINFVKFRIEHEGKEIKNLLLLLNPHYKFENIDVAIFGEVLEHLDNPLEVLQHFNDIKTKYIFTSSYPFRNDNTNDDYWKHPGHEEHNTALFQPDCRELLFANYERIQYNGEASLWVRK